MFATMRRYTKASQVWKFAASQHLVGANSSRVLSLQPRLEESSVDHLLVGVGQYYVYETVEIRGMMVLRPRERR